MNELKPCPLCGNEVLLDREDIFCNYCHLVLRFDDYIYTGEARDLKEARKMAIEAWNKRVENSTEIVYTCRTDKFKKIKAEAYKEFAERLRNRLFNYYDGLTENTSKSNHNGDSLMFYEVTDMIVDCIDNTMKEMTEGEDEN